MKFKRHIIVMLLTFAVVAVGIFAGFNASADTVSHPDALYKMYVTDYTDQADGSCDATLELYVYYYNGQVIGDLNAAQFGLSFTANMQVTFQPDADSIQLFQPGEQAQEQYSAPGQHFFMWSRAVEGNGAAADAGMTLFGGSEAGTDIAFGEEVSIQAQEGGFRMHIGTYTLHMEDGLPTKNAIRILDWEDTTWSGKAPFKNILPEIWNDVDQDGEYAYQGFHQAVNSLETEAIDLPLVFTAPQEWSPAFAIVSYDPAKALNITLYDDADNIVADNFTIPVWTADTREDSSSLYAVGGNADSGIGVYTAMIDPESCTIAENMAITAGETYIMEISKPGHLTQRISLTPIVDGSLSGAEGLPESELYLPGGDVNPVAAGADFSETVFGDGFIDMQDRAAILTLMGTDASDATDDMLAYHADIDGDGRISQADLSIISAPDNWGQAALR